jgi:UDP-4-amino-4,6-dideoxy-N-acetyl-beta-L-altrosamine N-acetyltransferase
MSAEQPSRLSVRPMGPSDLARVLAWRNDIRVRRFMFSPHEIAMDDHRSWFERSLENPAIHLLVFERDAEPQGFINFNSAAGAGRAEWGFYTAPEAPRGTGQMLGRAALDHAFDELRFSAVVGKVLGYNERSLHMHEALGFQREAVLPDQHFDGERHHDVVCFCLTAAAWKKFLNQVTEKR